MRGDLYSAGSSRSGGPWLESSMRSAVVALESAALSLGCLGFGNPGRRNGHASSRQLSVPFSCMLAVKSNDPPGPFATSLPGPHQPRFCLPFCLALSVSHLTCSCFFAFITRGFPSRSHSENCLSVARRHLPIQGLSDDCAEASSPSSSSNCQGVWGFCVAARISI